eukprot:CAMPEP_0167778350 /NCGR_PEP_ID=MMETSP0111_2-20121227/4204_1 /TAXON_ID=91324 /ORGANISM="Lotharella globosa, Strain CCCM811" /LENGTH=337 /DNA_ID=CAMNT_0007668643 /DNA_START=14 /DNA_END=1027 /DNA_ORIENTATION=-
MEMPPRFLRHIFGIAFLSSMFVAIFMKYEGSEESKFHDVEVVLAHYDEDLTWVSEARNLHPSIVYTTYSKSDQPPKGTIHIRNVGRESHTFLYHIVKNYDQLSDWTVFSQAASPGWGFTAQDHESGHMCSGVTWNDYIERKPGMDWYEVQTVATKYPEIWHSDRFDMMFQNRSSKGEICPQDSERGWGGWWTEKDHPTISFRESQPDALGPVEFYNEHVAAGNKTFKSFTLNYANGGRFAVARERILLRPRKYYENLLVQLSKSISPIEGYYMEAMWYDVFHPDRLQAEHGPVCRMPRFPPGGATNHSIMFKAALMRAFGTEKPPKNVKLSSAYLVD